ncbi:phosphotransferase enzyme family protein [Aspergillus flavus]|nr:phosphotransferase enzyme family protein [Aspergillus flavus]
MEVEALHVIQEKTSLPVPEVYAWGLARENRLGLGPFILINFINGICLGEVFGGGSSRLIREDNPDADIEFLYRQMAHIMLQFYRIDFSQIGSLPTLQTKFPAPGHPLTWKAHEILRVGGVDTLVIEPMVSLRPETTLSTLSVKTGDKYGSNQIQLRVPTVQDRDTPR